MEEADYGMTSSAFNTGSVVGDDQLYVRFYLKQTQNKAKTLEEGRPIFEDLPWIEIHQPGNKLSSTDRPATEADKRRFAKHWRAFSDLENQEVLTGTPLEQWPGITRSQIEELKYLKIRSIEQLINLSDGVASPIMGLASLKRSAKAYLEAADQQKAANEIQATKAAFEEQQELNAELTDRLRLLESMMKNGMGDEPKRRGRPPKSVEE
jgi:hypothetical protein